MYTGETTTKTIYVGSEGVLKALSSTGMTLDELNAKIREGATISDDGSIIIDTGEETVEPEETTVTKQTISPEASEERVANESSATEAVNHEDAQPAEKKKGNGAVVVVIIIIVLVAAGVGGYFYFTKIRKPKSSTPVDKKMGGDLPVEKIPAVNEFSEVEESPVAEETPTVEEPVEMQEAVEDAGDEKEGGDKL